MNLKQLALKLRREVGLYNFSKLGNPFYDLFTGGKNRPAFFDIDKTLPVLREIDAAYPDIREEFEAF